MNNVDVEGFYYGVINGKKIDSKQAAGTYGTFENCDITTIHRPFNLEISRWKPLKVAAL